MEYTGYLFVHFTGEQKQGEQIYFSLSRDGLHWNDLNQGEPILTSEICELGVRDPFILRDELTGKYVIIATDLCIYQGKGWDVAMYGGSRNLMVWLSDDCINWDGPFPHEVGIPGAGCVWAPEAIYDKDAGDYMVFWASMVKEEGDEKARQRIYASHTRDFINFGPVEKYMEDPVYDTIDTNILHINGTYYRFSKDETNKNLRVEKSTSLDKDSFTKVVVPVLTDLHGVEGPETFKFNDREAYCLITDQYAKDAGYLPLVFTDPEKDMRILDETEYDLGVSKKRHGGIMPITEAEYQALLTKWGTVR